MSFLLCNLVIDVDDKSRPGKFANEMISCVVRRKERSDPKGIP